MWYPHHGFGWESMIIGGLMMFLFWGGLIAVGAWLFRAYVGLSANRSSEHSDTDDRDRGAQRALDIVKERYARGEISKSEYEQIRADLSA